MNCRGKVISALGTKFRLHCHRYGAFNVQAGTLFCDADFQREVSGPLPQTLPS